MGEASLTNDAPSTWVLLDTNTGHQRQALGVADALGWPYETRALRYGPLARLPNAFLGRGFLGLTREARVGLAPPWPDLLIAAGRRTAPVARAIKRAASGATRLVQIMDPGSGGHGEFDLIAVPGHDNLSGSRRHGANVIRTLGAPHMATANSLLSARAAWADRLETLTAPRIGVFVGGGTRRRAFTIDMAEELAQALQDIKADTCGSLMVTTSPRTGDAADALFSSLGSFVDHAYKWGDEGENPYTGYLAWADRIVVTGDSVSMCSEACAAGASVQIYAPPGLITPKHARFHDMLYDAGFAGPLGQPAPEVPRQPLDVAGDIALIVRRLFD